MKNTFRVILTILLIITVSFTSCAKTGTAPENTAKPETVETIVALAPSINETLVDLGFGDKVIGYDTESAGIEGLNSDAELFDIVNPDLERLIALKPDAVLTSSISLYNADDPYKPLSDAGIKVIEVETSDSLSGIAGDIIAIADSLGASQRGREIADSFNSELDKISEIASSIPEDERKTVYFEIAAAPEMYSAGSGTYLNELIELAGAVNIFAESEGWMPVSGEAVAAADPDVILTNIDYLDDPVSEIMSRPGWGEISAVKNGSVYQIDNRSSSLPNENIVKAAKQVAKAVYPDYFSGI